MPQDYPPAPPKTAENLVNNVGTVLELNSAWNSPFLCTHATYLVSDREGLFGRACPVCKSYFRTDCMKQKLFCPYCSWKDENGAFTTDNQKRFLYFCFKAGEEAMTKRVKTVVDLGEVVKTLPNNKPAWAYSEENLQRTFRCKKCNIAFNILGEYGNCPSCGGRNSSLVFLEKMNSLEKHFAEIDSKLDKSKERDRLSQECRTFLVRCVSDFESMANDLRKQLLRIPSTPKRKNELSNMSFMRVLKAHGNFKNWYGIEILGGFSADDYNFLNRMFNRRHIVMHKGSQVDDEYLKNTNDVSVRLNQVIRIDSQEVRRLITLTKTAAQNLIGGYDSIQ